MRRIVTALTLIAAAALAGCGSDEDPAADAGTSAPQAAADAFPVTVEHQFGETTVPEEPKRVVSVGLTEQDTLLQLGVVPVATTEWYGDQPGAIWPWAQGLLDDLGGAEPEVLNADDGIEFEKIATLQPDLIVGVNAGLTKKDYELLSKIAPTIASVEGSSQYFSPWRDQVLQVARALGREDDGQALIDEADDAYAKVAAEHPDWAGKSATFSQGQAYEGIFYVYQDGLSTDFLTDLGFEITTGLEDYSPQAGYQAEISVENVNLLDADVIVWATEDEKMFDTLLGTGSVPDLDAVENNRSIYTDGTLAGAIYFDTPLSHLYVLERLTPALEQAVAGTAPRAMMTDS